MAKGAVLFCRVMGHAAPPVLRLFLMTFKAEVRLPFDEVFGMAGAVRKVAGPAIEPFRRFVLHCLLLELRLNFGMAFYTELAGLLSHHIGEITRMVGMAPQTIPFGKGLMKGYPRVGLDQPLVAAKT